MLISSWKSHGYAKHFSEMWWRCILWSYWTWNDRVFGTHVWRRDPPCAQRRNKESLLHSRPTSESSVPAFRSIMAQQGMGFLLNLTKTSCEKDSPSIWREALVVRWGAGGSGRRFCSIFHYFPFEQPEWNQGAIMPCDFGQWNPLKLWGNSL